MGGRKGLCLHRLRIQGRCREGAAEPQRPQIRLHGALVRMGKAQTEVSIASALLDSLALFLVFVFVFVFCFFVSCRLSLPLGADVAVFVKMLWLALCCRCSKRNSFVFLWLWFSS